MVNTQKIYISFIASWTMSVLSSCVRACVWKKSGQPLHFRRHCLIAIYERRLSGELEQKSVKENDWKKWQSWCSKHDTADRQTVYMMYVRVDLNFKRQKIVNHSNSKCMSYSGLFLPSISHPSHTLSISSAEMHNTIQESWPTILINSYF